MTKIYQIKLTEKSFEKLKGFIQDTSDCEIKTDKDVFDNLFTTESGELIDYDLEDELF